MSRMPEFLVTEASAISAWRTSEPLWQRRASCVAFVLSATGGYASGPELFDIIVQSCKALVEDSERFAQTAVGWVMREMSQLDRGRVIAFAEAQAGRMSREAMRSITAKMPARDKKRLLALHSRATGGSARRPRRPPRR